MKNGKAKKSKVKWIVLVIVLVACGAGGYLYINARGKAQQAMARQTVNVSPLMKTNLQNSISASGSVYSNTTVNVYSSLNNIVKAVNAEVGDEVKAGDVLAELDTESIESSILQAENNLKSAEDSLQNGLVNASSGVDSARVALEKQTTSYNKLMADKENNTYAQLVTAQTNVTNAERALETAKKDLETTQREYDSNASLYTAGALAKSTLDSSETALVKAKAAVEDKQAAHEKAIVDLQNAKTELDTAIKTAKMDLENARIAYDKAMLTLDQNKSEGSTAKTTLENQKLTLTTQMENLEKSKITAAISGTVTEKSANVGTAANGVLFVIEDTRDLYVSTRVKEYNLSKIALGQKATVTTDATSNEVFEGEVTYISPKAVTEADNTNVEFEVRIKITNANYDRIKIGMNAYANIITDTRENVFAVMYDAVTRVFGEGKPSSAVYVLDNNLVKAIPVQTGLQTDTSIEIIGETLQEGMQVISNPTAVTEGQTIDPKDVQQVAPNGLRIFRRQGGDDSGAGGGNVMVMPGGPGGAMPAGGGQVIIREGGSGGPGGQKGGN